MKQVPGGSLIQAILFPVLIMNTAISPDSALGRILELRLLQWTSRLSYSIYLWQQYYFVEKPTIGAGRKLGQWLAGS